MRKTEQTNSCAISRNLFHQGSLLLLVQLQMLSVQSPGYAGMERLGVPARSNSPSAQSAAGTAASSLSVVGQHKLNHHHHHPDDTDGDDDDSRGGIVRYEREWVLALSDCLTQLQFAKVKSQQYKY